MRVLECKFSVMAGILLLPAMMCHGSVSFKAEILPVLESKCIKCHQAPFEKDGRTVKPKAGLRLDAAWAILAGGESGIPAVVAKNVAKSHLFEVINLPKDDDMFMPPEGDAITEEEKTKIKTWIEEGADFGGWEGNLAGRPAAANSAETNQERDHEVLYKKLAEGISPPELSLIKSLKQSTGAQVYVLGTQSPLVRVDFLTGVTRCNDDSVKALEPIRDNIAHLDLARTKVGDGALPFIAGLPRLVRLDLRNTEVTDAGVEVLTKSKNLQVLNLFGTQITDAAMTSLAAIPSLKQVYLSETSVTEQGVSKLEKALPDAQIVGDLRLPDPEGRRGGGMEQGKRKRKKEK